MAQLDLATLVVKIKSDNAQFKQGVDQSTSASRKFGIDAKEMIGTAVAGAFAVAAAAAVKFANDSLVEFQKFETGMAEVFTLLPGLSEEAMGELEQQALEAGTQMGRIPDEAIPALYQALSAGVPQDNVFEFLATANAAAIGGVTDLETAVDGISSVVNAYGAEMIDATKASDLMFTAVRLGKTDFTQLSQSLFQVVPTAASLGLSFENLTAALAVMTAQGVPTSVATTQLRQALVELSKEGTIAADTFERVAGQSFAEFVASGGNLQEALALMADEAGRAGVPVSNLFSSVEAGAAALALTGGNAATFAGALAEMEGSAGATELAASQFDGTLARMEDTIQAQTSELMVLVAEGLAPTKKAWLELKQILLENAIELAKDSQARRESFQTMEEARDVQGDLIASINEFIDTNEVAISTSRGFEDAQEGVWEALDTVNAAFDPFNGSLEDAANNSAALEAMLGLLQDGFSGTGAELGAAAVAAVEFENRVENAATATDGWMAGLVGAQEAAAGYRAEIIATTPAIDGHVAAMLNSQEITEANAAAAEANEEAVDLERQAVEAATAALANYFVGATQATDAVGYFATTTTAAGVELVATTASTDLMNQSLYDAAVEAGASAEALAVLGLATGVLTEEQAEAALKSAILQAEITALAAAYAADEISISQLRVEMGNLVNDINNMDVSIGTATGSVEVLTTEVGAAGDEMVTAADRAREFGEAADDIAGTYDIVFNITQNGTMPEGGYAGSSGAGNIDIGENALGTDFWGGGWTWVGEDGMELVNLPAGSEIYSNEDSMAMVGGVTYQITVDARGSNLTERQIEDAVERGLQRASREADFVKRAGG